MELPKNYNPFKRGKIEKVKEETPLDKLLNILNEAREGKYKPLTYPRLNLMLKKLGKSKHGWSQNIWIANVLDRPNPSSYFGHLVKENKKKKK